ncbi:hypothetical protein [Allomesorhizobium camelthorni]|uniref:Uncharacterized protein n=1 Tax=Allomesorhizobium camelthorni TaxID=475069 RepID=A0A6G4W9I8_9HYPH|nr:hypothetical protein [Mesorhizobium camelthorni]NGO51234.1 hypothetical protein [Mesorhizobium camelthorni]
MRSDIEMPQPANLVPLPPIDYDHFRAIAVIERRKAIAAFPGSVRRWMKSTFQRLFSTSPTFRPLPAHATGHQNLWLKTDEPLAAALTEPQF